MMEKIGFVVYKIPAQVASGTLMWTPGKRAGNQRFAFNDQTPAPATVAVIAAPPTNQGGVAGQYVGPNKSMLTLKFDPKGGLEFELDALSPATSDGMVNTGSASGSLRLEGDKASYRDENMDCTLNFKFAAGQVVVEQIGMCGFGFNVSAAGVYKM